MKQVLHFDEEILCYRKKMAHLERLLENLELSDHWFDYGTKLRVICALEPRERLVVTDDEAGTMIEGRCGQAESPIDEYTASEIAV
jgi:hypothetical protein